MGVKYGAFSAGGPTSILALKTLCYQKNHIYEKFHSKLCKHVLGVSKQTPDILAKAEMGRYPLMRTILKQTYCYWRIGRKKTKIYLVEKNNVKKMACCIRDKYYKMYEKDFMDTLNNKSKTPESMGKFAIYCKVKLFL